jgi:hypothetical protein
MTMTNDDYGDEANWSADQSTWPEHLRDDAPYQKCGRCQRHGSRQEFNMICRMTQPDSLPCGGRFGPEIFRDTPWRNRS